MGHPNFVVELTFAADMATRRPRDRIALRGGSNFVRKRCEGKMKFRHFRLGSVRGVVNTRIQPWHRYHGFLTIIRERYEAEAKRYEPHPKPGVRIYRVTEDVRERLQLEVETFYLFANMLLDQIAVNVRFFFGFTRARKSKLHPNGEDWSHLTLLDKLAKDASAMGLSGDFDTIITQADAFRRLRTYRNTSITHWDASDTHLSTSWDGKDLTIHLGLVGSSTEVKSRRDSGFEFQMTVPIPRLYDMLDTYAATVQIFLEANVTRFVGK